MQGQKKLQICNLCYAAGVKKIILHIVVTFKMSMLTKNGF